MPVENWDHFFKPEIRRSGQALLDKGKVIPSRPTDTEVQCYIRTSSPFKVILKSATIDNTSLYANCTCKQFQKGQFCKHIWATILAVNEKNPDFFDNKRELHLKTSLQKIDPSANSTKSQQDYKQKQIDYRRANYLKQKQLTKDKKISHKQKNNIAKSSPEIEKALDYFLQNGFALNEDLNLDTISAARKKLARVFHPDRGGNHNEILELNQFADILLKFVKAHL